MADDDDFQPRLGRMRNRGGKRAKAYLSRVLAASFLAGGRGSRGAAGRQPSRARLGRGAGIGRLAAGRVGGHRRVVVKTSIVRLAAKGAGAAAAHLRYLERDGTTREGEAGQLYGRDDDAIDRRDFHDRCKGDRHQFRLIVSAEDGDQYEDLRPLTRRLMERVEEDLGTKLDWVAVDHFNTGYPHTHIVVRGKDDRGQDLVIAREYLSSGLRARAAELVELDLGPPTTRELHERLRRSIDDERLTAIDRTLIAHADGARYVDAAHADPVTQSLRAGRLAKLARLGLAQPAGGARFQLAEDLESTLRTMGERGDIVRTMQRAMAERAPGRPLADQAIFDPLRSGDSRLVGRVMIRGLADEGRDRHFVIVDAIDGRTHYVDIGSGSGSDMIGEGAIVAIAGRRSDVRPADHAITAVAGRHGGSYSVDHHLSDDPAASEEFAAAHVRRLEAARRAGLGVERSSTGAWTVPADYIEQVERWETKRSRDVPVTIEMLSDEPLDRVTTASAATWLDRDLASSNPVEARAAGFGAEVIAARERRRQWLRARDLASGEGAAFALRSGALQMLERRDLEAAAERISGEAARPCTLVEPGDRVEGIYRRRVDLASGRFALLERAHDFALVPWRPRLDQQVGRPVSGLVREGGFSWTRGRERGGPSIG